ncbi:MAG: pyruvate kinase [Clostridiales bacterium]|nr:pyruvate kinase [Clostridiales bacterium]
MRKTKIICTLGPAIDNDEMLIKMIENGLDCARLNFSHGNYDEHFKRIERVKKLRKKLNKHIPILLDTKGPEIRLKKFENDSVCIEDGQEFTLYAEERLGNKFGASVTYPYCAEKLKVGNRILIDDGKVEIEVIKIEGKDVVCKVNNGGKISNNKSINLPDCPIDMPYISDRDKNDIIFGAKHGVDYIAASFVRCKDDVLQVRNLLNENDGGEVKIIAKIENAQGVDNIDEIVDVSDGIMIARGDMGVELPFTALPKIQKDIIKKCFRQGKIVITATQMLESMTKCPRPTRAEVSDIANAIYDGTTAIMLSGESAAGDYPVESVNTMAHIAESTEAVIKYYSRFEKSALLLGNDQLNAICKAACEASYCLNAKAIVTLSRNGRTPKLISNYRPNCPILGAVLNEKACRQLNLAWNVKPVLAEEMFSTDDLLKEGIALAIKEKMATIGDTIILTCSAAIGDFITDLMKIHIISEEDMKLL